MVPQMTSPISLTLMTLFHPNISFFVVVFISSKRNNLLLFPPFKVVTFIFVTCDERI